MSYYPQFMFNLRRSQFVQVCAGAAMLSFHLMLCIAIANLSSWLAHEEASVCPVTLHASIICCVVTSTTILHVQLKDHDAGRSLEPQPSMDILQPIRLWFSQLAYDGILPVGVWQQPR